MPPQQEQKGLVAASCSLLAPKPDRHRVERPIVGETPPNSCSIVPGDATEARGSQAAIRWFDVFHLGGVGPIVR
jgi:hypothetical protein